MTLNGYEGWDACECVKIDTNTHISISMESLFFLVIIWVFLGLLGIHSHTFLHHRRKNLSICRFECWTLFLYSFLSPFFQHLPHWMDELMCLCAVRSIYVVNMALMHIYFTFETHYHLQLTFRWLAEVPQKSISWNATWQETGTRERKSSLFFQHWWNIWTFTVRMIKIGLLYIDIRCTRMTFYHITALDHFYAIKSIDLGYFLLAVRINSLTNRFSYVSTCIFFANSFPLRSMFLYFLLTYLTFVTRNPF